MLAKVVMLAILTLSFLIDRSSAATFKLENFVSKNVTFVVNSLGNSSLAQNIAAWNTNNNQN
jgi:DNA-directed RNA polymerase alpha subunit